MLYPHTPHMRFGRGPRLAVVVAALLLAAAAHVGLNFAVAGL